MVEWEPLELDLGGVAHDELRPGLRAWNRSKIGAGRRVGHDHDLLDGRQRSHDRGEFPQAVVDLATIEVTIRRDEHPGLDLPEPVEDPLSTEVRRAGRPDG